MKTLALLLMAAAIAVSQTTEPEAPAAESKTKSETLRFEVNWPSGLSLGEGELVSSATADGWSFSMKLYAAIPAFAVSESARSKATQDLCSLELRKQGVRGKRETDETTTFDSDALTATRKTGKGGGKSEMRTGGCPRDALTFIQFLRRELASGRLPASQPVYYGGAYQTRIQYVGTQQLTFGGESVEADKLTATIKSSAKEFTVDLFFARDAARTPVVAEIPVAVGKFTVEFLR